MADGDSFWTVAERLTSARLGRPAGDGEVLEPWLALIEANRDRLTDPGDPYVLFPGPVLRLPEGPCWLPVLRSWPEDQEPERVRGW